MELSWKSNWLETRQHLVDWWNHTGLVVGSANQIDLPTPRENISACDKNSDINRFYTDGGFHACCEHERLAKSYMGGDILPIASVDIGPGSLALYLGSEPGFSIDTVWFYPSPNQLDHEIRFDPDSRWWHINCALIEQCLKRAQNNYMVGFPDLIENVDILSSLIGSENMLMELVEHPQLVLQRLAEINQAWYQAYSLIYDLIHLKDGSSTWGAFALWGPGKTAKIQCDAAAMLSPKMFRKFVVPFLTEQCRWVDYSMYHLDGSQCLCHLDALLEIEPLKAIEWTANPVVPSDGDPTWYPMYRRILASGKSVQIVDVKVEEVIPLLDAIGGKGVYLFVKAADRAEYEAILKKVEAYRA